MMMPNTRFDDGKTLLLVIRDHITPPAFVFLSEPCGTATFITAKSDSFFVLLVIMRTCLVPCIYRLVLVVVSHILRIGRRPK